MDKKTLFAVLLGALMMWSCGDDNPRDVPLAFSLSHNSVEFLFGISADSIVRITSGNGWYNIDVKDETVVEVEPEDGDYELGAFRFSPKKIGSTTVTLTDIIGYDYKNIPVTVHEAAISLTIDDIQPAVEIDNETLKKEIELNSMLFVPFRSKVPYIFSNEERGILYGYDKEEKDYVDVRSFSHTKSGGNTYLIMTADEDGDGVEDYSRTLQVIMDVPITRHSYTSFYGLTLTDTRAEQVVTSSVIYFVDDMTEIYREQERYQDVASVKLTYKCEYEFAPFVDPAY